ncbi:MbeB family mobilization protein [Pantoea dispersa]|uniref:MbeB family mobilization protein n=1 Tax=Pantoea dispersa TaxID=59814 RepID=UPI001BA83DA4|nr:MbeB family mobilization protein [Pantoea dispersa]MBS0907777.1 MbeB family mobilization protein [Pantoea dispersa]
MSSLLTLGQDLEQKSKEQRERTAAMLKAAFSEHEQSVRAELSESERKINAAISAHELKLTSAIDRTTTGMLKTVVRTWLVVVLTSVLLIGTSWGILRWQSQKILDNASTISEQSDTLTKLNARTWGVRFQEDNNGRFLVLPAGTTTDTQQTWHVGERQALKLIQE